jgi:hypothetical protein
MDMKDILREAAIQELEEANLAVLGFYPLEKRNVLACLYNNGIIDDETILPIIEKKVLKQARKDYEFLQKHKDATVGHDVVPDCISYALGKRVFSDEEAAKIRFERDENPERLIEFYGSKDRLNDIKERLLDTRPDAYKGFDPHPACC